jgi:hypothetical protein
VPVAEFRRRRIIEILEILRCIPNVHDIPARIQLRVAIAQAAIRPGQLIAAAGRDRKKRGHKNKTRQQSGSLPAFNAHAFRQSPAGYSLKIKSAQYWVRSRR